MEQREGATYCSLPWCGQSFGAPYHSRVFRLPEHVRLTYPSCIEYHDIVPRSQGGDPDDLGNNVPICINCHSAHHSDARMRLTFDGLTVTRADGLSGELVLGDREGIDVGVHMTLESMAGGE